MRVALHHRTHYAYDQKVGLGPHVIRLRPAPHCRTPIEAYALRVEPADHFLNWQQDPFGNWQARLDFRSMTRELTVEVDLVADMVAYDPFGFFVEDSAEHWPFSYAPDVARDLEPYMVRRAGGPKFHALLAELRSWKRHRTIDFLVDANRHVNELVKYVIRLEPGRWSPEQTLTNGKGACRDSAWLLVQLFRYLGVAARFCSGYLLQLTADRKSIDGPSGPAEDFTDLHAWAEVYLPGAGWIGLDPTSGLLTAEGHIPVAATPDPDHAAPVTGYILAPAESTLTFEMSVRRLEDPPRATKPYSEDQWQSILSFGSQVDEWLVADDVRLTMGGEPTFVGIDDRDAPEWNLDAVGLRKRRLGGQLIRRLRQDFAPGGLLHYGQGKWYPGEQLPRWSLTLFWRTDGQPLWRDPDRIADPSQNLGHTEQDALALLRGLCERLNVTPEFVRPAYEDPWEYIRKERELPINLDPRDNKLEDPLERQRLATIFERGLTTPRGYVLPLDRRRFSPARWVTGPWPVRTGELFLIPGDSPVGLRLPLGSLPWVPDTSYPYVHPQDPLAVRRPLPPPRQLQIPQSLEEVSRTRARLFDEKELEKYKGRNVVPDVRTALCVEPRDGVLHVFLPPTRCNDDFVDLVGAIEEVCAALDLALVLEGYQPFPDENLKKLSVAPDPGVLEVNVHPSASWGELVRTTETLYEAARQSRLCAEKYLVDGRPVGSGGGAHVTLGGPTPLDSPFLRRPDLLRSMVTYFLNHPSLSYIFSGQFIGPTSQAPRIDDARMEDVYELEIALQQVPFPEANVSTPAWLVDRIFRHVLTDVTGNTHRAEFCIDKLYSPDSATGRLGLLEMRGFEMPPDPRMNLAHQVLLRAIVARCWRHPYREPVHRWGKDLHDRFLLPFHLERDLLAVIRDLQDHGLPAQLEWYAAHLDFRFPKLGMLEHDGMQLELRCGLEPWNTLGEEPGMSTTTRFVDASLERLQVLVRALHDERYVLACNGRRVPLHRAGTTGDYVAGVRFRAHMIPNVLHPTIGAHDPLVFDWIDTRLGRSVAGCTYYSEHPGGRNPEGQPVNERDAESRRLSRFQPFGHTPGPMMVPLPEQNPYLEHTLDLRYDPSRWRNAY